MPLPRPIATIPYKNNIDERIPPYAVLQFSSDAESTDKYISVKVTKPDGTGKHFAIDNGKGAMESSDDKYCYGECIKAFIGTFWAHYVSATPPATAWDTEVGPVSGEWYVNDTGTGFVYAGVHDPDNQRIMVMQLAGGGGGESMWFVIHEVICAAGYNDTSVLVEWTHYTKSCENPPGMDQYTGLIEVHDICALSQYPVDELIGMTGRATYMYKRITCELLWRADFLCGQPSCAQ